jgi:PEP-CTERM motif
MMKRGRVRVLPVCSLILMAATTVTMFLSAAISANGAPLTLTGAGVADGFNLTTFVSGFGVGDGGVGPLGVAVAGNGNVIVDASNLSKNYVFTDVNGQTLASAISSTAFFGFPPAYASSGGSVYGSYGGRFVKFNNDGTINTTYNVLYPGLAVTNGMWTNPLNGHIIATGGGQIYDIDVSGAIPTFRVIVNALSDGITVSPDGATVYTNAVTGYSIATGAVTFPTLSVPGGPDGLGLISSSNSLNGDIIVNTNGGTLVLIDPSTRMQTIIASGGTRGDYTSPDPTNGSLFVTQSNEVLRLDCGVGCGIGAPPPSNVPEPATLGLVGFSLAGLAIVCCRKPRSSRRAKLWSPRSVI